MSGRRPGSGGVRPRSGDYWPEGSGSPAGLSARAGLPAESYGTHSAGRPAMGFGRGGLAPTRSAGYGRQEERPAPRSRRDDYGHTEPGLPRPRNPFPDGYQEVSDGYRADDPPAYSARDHGPQRRGREAVVAPSRHDDVAAHRARGFGRDGYGREEAPPPLGSMSYDHVDPPVRGSKAHAGIDPPVRGFRDYSRVDPPIRDSMGYGRVDPPHPEPMGYGQADSPSRGSMGYDRVDSPLHGSMSYGQAHPPLRGSMAYSRAYPHPDSMAYGRVDPPIRGSMACSPGYMDNSAVNTPHPKPMAHGCVDPPIRGSMGGYGGVDPYHREFMPYGRSASPYADSIPHSRVAHGRDLKTPGSMSCSRADPPHPEPMAYDQVNSSHSDSTAYSRGSYGREPTTPARSARSDACARGGYAGNEMPPPRKEMPPPNKKIPRPRSSGAYPRGGYAREGMPQSGDQVLSPREEMPPPRSRGTNQQRAAAAAARGPAGALPAQVVDAQSSPPLGRVLSNKSMMVSTDLDSIAQELQRMSSISDRADSVLADAHADIPPGLRNELSQLHGHVNSLLATRLDAIITGELHSGRDQARARRKELIRDAEALIERIEQQVQTIDRRAGK